MVRYENGERLTFFKSKVYRHLEFEEDVLYELFYFSKLFE